MGGETLAHHLVARPVPGCVVPDCAVSALPSRRRALEEPCHLVVCRRQASFACHIDHHHDSSRQRREGDVLAILRCKHTEGDRTDPSECPSESPVLAVRAASASRCSPRRAEIALATLCTRPLGSLRPASAAEPVAPRASDLQSSCRWCPHCPSCPDGFLDDSRCPWQRAGGSWRQWS
jgi:hypothetical protein